MFYDSLYTCIFNDIQDVLIYLNNGIKISFIYAILFITVSCFIYYRQIKKNQSNKNMSKDRFLWHFIGSTLFVIYFYVLCNIVYFSREPGSRAGVDMRLFSTWGTTSQAHAYVIENVILFIPFGFLFPACISRKLSVLTIFAGALCSVCIEYIQYRTGCGYCQIDDIITNTLGTAIGYIFLISIVKITQNKEKIYGR